MIHTIFIVAALLGVDADDDRLFQSTASRSGTRIRFFSEADTNIVDITSEFGIDQTTIRRKSDKWPKTFLVRLHLRGLESFRVRGKAVAVEWSVSSTGEHETSSSLLSGKQAVAIAKDSPYFSELRIVSNAKKIPLEHGYFEVQLPLQLLDGNPQEITLEWIDFYRR